MGYVGLALVNKDLELISSSWCVVRERGMELLQRSLIKTILGGDCIEFHKVCLSVCFGSVEHREGQFGGAGALH